VSATDRHASGRAAWPTGEELASRRSLPGWRGMLRWAGLGAGASVGASVDASVDAGVGNPARRLGVTALVAVAVTITAIAAAVAAANPGARPSGHLVSGAQLTGPVAPGGAAPAVDTAWAYTAPATIGQGHAVASHLPGPSAPLALTAVDRRDCPTAAAACVNLATHITWLQSDGQVSFGPVRMEPGEPGSVHATPRGTFQVGWKAGPNFVSDIYNEPMPWATFFAPGGVAFHGGSLTHWSHGCVHLTIANAHYYHQHLPIGAEVVVF
jgi:lipoprotein-anchoring transpeptidase ErfK/SrfK